MSLARATDLRPRDARGARGRATSGSRRRGRPTATGRTSSAPSRHASPSATAWWPPVSSTSTSCRARTPCAGRTSRGWSETPRRARSRCCSSTTPAASRATSRTPTPTVDASPRPGVTVVFCADNLIAGNVDTYELEGLKTVADAAYIRRLSRNVGRGYEQKWRLFDDPGGNPPLGSRGRRRPPAAADPSRARTSSGSGGRSPLRLGYLERRDARRRARADGGAPRRVLVNPLYAGRVIRHKGRPDEEERRARFAAPVDPDLFERVQAIRAERRTRHPGMTATRRPYPLVRLMRCVHCDSTYKRRGRQRLPAHPPRPGGRVCSPSATYRAERYEDAGRGVARGCVHSRTGTSVASWSAMRARVRPACPRPTQTEIVLARERLAARTSTEEEIADRGVRAALGGDSSGRPASSKQRPDELRLARARRYSPTSGPCGATPRCQTA